jgi:hypothetical protein
MQRLEVDRRQFPIHSATEHNTRSFLQLRLPLRDLVGMHIELLRQLGDRSVALDRRQRDFRLEYRRVIPAGSSWHNGRLIASPITWLISGSESTYNAVRFSGATSELNWRFESVGDPAGVGGELPRLRCPQGVAATQPGRNPGGAMQNSFC